MMTTVGRGRGNWGTREAPVPLRKPGELTRSNSEEEDGILSAIALIDISDKCKCENIELQIKNYCDDREHLWKMTQRLYDSGLNDRITGEKIVQIWKGLSKFEVNEVKLRSVIMSIAQKEFEEREDNRREDHKRFLNSIALLGGIFHYLTLPTGDPYTVLINPLIEYYQFLLQECSKEISCREEELELLAWEFNLNGTLLKKYGEESLSDLMLQVRAALVASHPSEKCHYWLLLILDLSLHSWNHQRFPPTLKKFYSEKIGKSFNLLTYHPLPSVQDDPKNSITKVQVVEEPVAKKYEGGPSRDSNHQFKDDNFDRNRRDRQQDRNVDQYERKKPAYWGHDDRFDHQDDSSGGYRQQRSFGGRRGSGGRGGGDGHWRGRGDGGGDGHWRGRGGEGEDGHRRGRGGEGGDGHWRGRGDGHWRGRGGDGGSGNWRGRGDGRPKRDFNDGGRWNEQSPRDNPSGPRDNSSVPDFPTSGESWD